MQKFTVFSILLSLSVILAIGDIIFHDYLKGQSSANTFPVEEEFLPAQQQSGSETDPQIEEEEDTSVDLTEDTQDKVLEPTLNIELFEEAGFQSPVLKDTIFSGLVFQFISFSDQNDANIYQWNLFDREQYIGSLYQIRYHTETACFQGYLALRERAGSLAQLGTVNEVNNYGDASFYFNHNTKVKTIHLIFRSGSSIYAFEYSRSYHETMKDAFDRVNSLL